jgi:prepilin peptidase CpaA
MTETAMMSHETAPTPPSTPAASPPDDLGLDRAFLLQMAQVPFIAVGIAAVTLLASWAVAPTTWQFGTSVVNPVPVLVISLGMILAAVIDGMWFKVPNWLTLPLVVSGWILGLASDLGWQVAGPEQGGVLASFIGMAVGFALLFPILFIGGMGQGDVKMQMAFGAWVAMIFGNSQAMGVLCWGFVFGVLAGGVIGLIMMLLRWQFDQNLRNMGEIITDMRVLATQGAQKAKERAQSRRPSWYRLPYGIPLCIGYVGYLVYLLLYPVQPG